MKIRIKGTTPFEKINYLIKSLVKKHYYPRDHADVQFETAQLMIYAGSFHRDDDLLDRWMKTFPYADKTQCEQIIDGYCNWCHDNAKEYWERKRKLKALKRQQKLMDLEERF